MKKPDKVLVEQFAMCIRDWSGTGELKGVYAADRKRLRPVLSAFRKGDYVGAYLIAIRMDTIVREVIPGKAWDLMTEAYREEVKP